MAAPNISKKIFIYNVDSYIGKTIAELLSCYSNENISATEEEASSYEANDHSVNYLIRGCVANKHYKKPDFIDRVTVESQGSDCQCYLLESDVIIFNITDDPESVNDAYWALKELSSASGSPQKLFILISTLLTWARSKPLDESEKNMPFTEDDFRRRLPHPNFVEHLKLEKTVARIGHKTESGLKTYIIASGITYGYEEHVLQYLFKAAWKNKAQLSCFGKGNGILPTIHVADLASIVKSIIENPPVKLNYLIAVDDGKNTLAQITQAVSTAMGSGVIKYVDETEALLSSDMKQTHFDMITSYLHTEASYVKTDMLFDWKAPFGMVKHIQQLVHEFKESLNIQPIQVLICGMPSCGKSTVAKEIARIYGLEYLQMKTVIDEEIIKLKETMLKLSDNENTGENNDDQTIYDKAFLDDITVCSRDRFQDLEDRTVARLHKFRLLSPPCQNQGYVLDGYPKYRYQAAELFDNGDGDDQENVAPTEHNILPQYIFYLEADPSILKAHFATLPEQVFVKSQGYENAMDRFTSRMASYQTAVNDNNTAVTYFERQQLFVEKIDVSNDLTSNFKKTIARIVQILGNPKSIEMTPEEILEEKYNKIEISRAKEINAHIEQKLKEKEKLADVLIKRDELQRKFNEEQAAEESLINPLSQHIRKYVENEVLETLTLALIDVCDVRPDNPIDYLAEYLFKHNSHFT